MNIACRKIPALMCIDVEPDDFFIDRGNPVPWLGFEATYEYFSALRPRLAAITGQPVHYLWFFRMDPQIAETYGSSGWAAANYGGFVDELLRRGDPIGLHTHAYRWEPRLDSWVIDHGNQSWVNQCVKRSFESYRECFGTNCRCFRFGDGWINQETLRLVEQLGAEFDLTLEPGQKGRPTCHPGKPYTGEIPDLDGIPRYPYRLPVEDFRNPEPRRNTGMWLIPLSSGSLKVPCEKRGFLGRVFRTRRFVTESRTLNVSFEPSSFRQTFNEVLTGETPYVGMVVRSDVALKPEPLRNMEQAFEHVIAHPISKQLVFCTPDEALERMGLHQGEVAQCK